MLLEYLKNLASEQNLSFYSLSRKKTQTKTKTTPTIMTHSEALHCEPTLKVPFSSPSSRWT